MVALNVPPKSSPVVYIRAGNDDHKNMFESESIIVTTLAKLGEVHVIDTAAADPADCLKGFVNDEISFYVKVVGLIDPKLEINRLEKRVKQLSQLADKLIAKTKAPGYEQKVPEKIRNDNADKIATYQSELQEIEKSKATLAQFAK